MKLKDHSGVPQQQPWPDPSKVPDPGQQICVYCALRLWGVCGWFCMDVCKVEGWG